MVNRVTGIILAGGKNSRMGSDKGMLMLNGKRFIEHILDALVPVVNEVIIISNNSNYDDLGWKIYSDIITDCGPMGGIYTGLVNTATSKNLILSCDIPFISSAILLHLIKESDHCEIAVPEHAGRIEPLCGIYSKNCTEKIRTLLENKEWKLKDALRHFITKQVRFSGSNENEKRFLNINTPLEFSQQIEK